MKVSLNWLRDFLDIHKETTEIADILTSLGLEVEGWEDVKPSPVDLDKVLTGQVLTCERIPETDHLSATTVDTGDGIVRSIVCGAPNVAAGQKVLVAIPGANVFSKDGQLFAIGERKVKGVLSQGMICAQDELGIGHDHSGIMVLPADTPLGITAAKLLKKDSDTVIEIGLTPNRADATSHLGIAKDLLAWLRVHEDSKAALKVSLTEAALDPGQPDFNVEVADSDACPRYCGYIIRGLKVAESPEWLKNRLLAVGQRPINNVVDVTNYIRVAYGQPLHAFDLHQIGGNGIKVRCLPEGTPFKTLDGVERKLFAEDLMICDADNKPMCIAGVFGGSDSGVTEQTTAIFLESAVFNPKWIRRSMLRHSLRTDAAWTFEKGVDPAMTLVALRQAMALILDLAGGAPSEGFFDLYPKPVEAALVETSYSAINRLIGENLSRERVQNILAALDIVTDNLTEDRFTALIPTNKPDVTREADVIEEILRVHGLDAVPIPMQIRSSMEVPQYPNLDSVRNTAADFLVANGFNECMSLALSNSAYHTEARAIFPLDKNALVYIHNSANQGLDCLRPTMLFSALEAVQRNQNRQNPNLRLFELGKTYRRSGEALEETLRLSLLVTGAHSSESWQPSAKASVDFYTLKAYAQNLLARLGLSAYQESVEELPQFQYAVKWHRGPQELGVLGLVTPAISKKMDIKNPVFFADLNFEQIFKASAGSSIRFTEISKYPSVRRDLALILNRGVAFGEIKALANKTAKKILKDVNLFDVFEDESKLGAGKKSYAVSFIFEDPEKTLQDKEIEALMQQLQSAFESKLGAEIRKNS